MVVPLSIIVSNEVATWEELIPMLASEIFQNVGCDDEEED